MKHNPPPQRTCLQCGTRWNGGFASAMYRQIHGTDPPPICSFCGGPLTDYHPPELPPVRRRVKNLLGSSLSNKIDDLRRRLYV